MSDSADIAARAQRFNERVRTFTPPSPARHAKLMPLKDGIVELREKGASLRLIRELLLTVDVAVSADTIARFLAEVSAASTPGRVGGRTVVATAPQARTAAVHAVADPPPQPSTPPALPPNDTPPERPRTRGPRIADPRNL